MFNCYAELALCIPNKQAQFTALTFLLKGATYINKFFRAVTYKYNANTYTNIALTKK